MLDMLELIGPSGNDFHTSIVFTYAFDFTLAIADYVYVLDAKFQRFKTGQ